METSNGINELFILLGNEMTICMPYYVENGNISCKQLHSSKIPSILSITGSKISIGKMNSLSQPTSKRQDICGFVDSFFGLTNDLFITEMRRQCSCDVVISAEGRVEYRVKNLNNQILTPGFVLKLFLKYVILYECRRSNIQIKNVTVAYPVYCSRYHEEYLASLLQSLDSYNIRCVSQLPCFITSLSPVDFSPSSPTNVLLFYAGYGLFHIFACTVSSRHLAICRHLKSTQVSHQSFINRIYNDILEKMQKKTFCSDSSATLFKACYQMLDRLSIQTIASMNLQITEGQLVYTVTDDSVYYMMRPLLNHLSSDINKLLTELCWSRIPVILTGESSSLFIYRRWFQHDFPILPFCCCYDVMEMVLHNMNPGLSVLKNTTEPTETHTLFSVMNEGSSNVSVPSNIRPMSNKNAGDKSLKKTETNVSAIDKSLKITEPNVSATDKSLKKTETNVSATDKLLKITEPSTSVNDKSLKRTETNVSTTDKSMKITETNASSSQTDLSKLDTVPPTPSQVNTSQVSSTKSQSHSMTPCLSMAIEVSISQDDRNAIFIPKESNSNTSNIRTKNPSPISQTKSIGSSTLSKSEAKKEKETKAKVSTKTPRKLPERSHRKASDSSLLAIREQKKSRRRPREEKKEKKEKKEEVKESSGTSFIWVSSDPIVLPKEPVINFLSEFNTHKMENISIYSVNGKWEENLTASMYTSPSLNEQMKHKSDDRTRVQRYTDGSMYSGSVSRGKRHGSGTLTYPDGSNYQGSFRENCRHGHGSLRKNNKCYFDGMFKNDKPVSGILTFCNGARYDGTFDEGKPHGEGTYYANGHDATWDGQWDHGVMDGSGAYFFDNNDYFDGMMLRGRPHGTGKIYTKKGRMIVEGEWKNGVRDGSFVLFMPDNSYWKVTYVQDVLEGDCSFYDEASNLMGQGTFHNHLFTGKGKFVFVDGTRFEGSVKNGQYDKKGRFQYGNNMSLTAVYENGIKEGMVEICQNGELVFRGYCVKGRIQGSGRELKHGVIVYDGEYVNGVRSGNATVTMTNGFTYKGMVKNNMLSGMGTVYSEKGKVLLQGRFRKNMYIGSK